MGTGFSRNLGWEIGNAPPYPSGPGPSYKAMAGIELLTPQNSESLYDLLSQCSLIKNFSTTFSFSFHILEKMARLLLWCITLC